MPIISARCQEMVMALPAFNQDGDLPPWVYPASLAEVIERFGQGTSQRQQVADRLRHIHKLAYETGQLDRMIIFGSFVTDKPKPNDVDVILVMKDTFRPEQVVAEAMSLFDHQRADRTLGASIFWLRPGMLLGESLESFIAGWRLKRDGTLRGIVEVIHDS